MSAEVLTVLRRLADERMTLLMLIHQMKFARDLCSRIFHASGPRR